MLGTRIDLNTGRYLFAGRIALAVTALIVAISDPEGVGWRAEPDDVVALVAVIINLGFVAICFRSWWWQYQLRHVETALDFALVLAVMFTFDPTALGKHGLEVVAVALAAIRIGIVSGLRPMHLLFAGYALLFAVLAYCPTPVASAENPDFLVLRVVTMIGLIAAVLTNVIANRTIDPIVTVPPGAGSSLSEYLAAAGLAAHRGMHHRPVLIVWQSCASQPRIVITANGGRTAPGEPVCWPFPGINQAQVAALVYDIGQTRCLALLRDGTMQASSDCPVAPEAARHLAQLGPAIVAVPMQGAAGEGSSWLVPPRPCTRFRWKP